MTYWPITKTTTADSAAIDAFGRSRVSTPTTIFDSKQLTDKAPSFWDEKTSGGTETSTHSVPNASTTMTVNLSGEFVIRQTKMRFNYQPGKSQNILCTFVLGSATTNVSKKVGYFNTATGTPFTASEDGVYIEQDGTTQYLVIAKNGSTTGTRIAQTNWNIDTFDGSGPSAITIDWTKAQIMTVDFEWLGVGRVRIGFVINGLIYYAHEFLNANNVTSVYMSSPNHSVRYEIRSTGGSASLQQICCSVQAEGGEDALGLLRYVSTAGTHVDASVENTIYAVVGVRLKSTHLNTTVRLLNAAIQVQTSPDNIEWLLIFNPTVAGTFTYNDITNSAVQYALGATANTVTGGEQLAGAFLETGSSSGGSAGREISNALRLGATIDGVRDTIVLCVRPVAGSANVDVEGGLYWRELV